MAWNWTLVSIAVLYLYHSPLKKSKEDYIVDKTRTGFIDSAAKAQHSTLYLYAMHII